MRNFLPRPGQCFDILSRCTIFLLFLLPSPQSFGQTTYAYNPDSNFDGYYGVDDLMSFLSLFGTTVPQSQFACDYQGNSVENLFLGHMQETLSIDSIWMEFELLDVVSYFLPGCPEAQTDTVIFVGSKCFILPMLGRHFQLAARLWGCSG